MFELPVPPRYRLERNPLALALAQLKFPFRARLRTAEGLASVQDALEGTFPYLEIQEVEEISLDIGPAASTASETESVRTWSFTNDEGWSFLLTADTATLTAGKAYAGASNFADHFHLVLDALATVGSVHQCDRLGVRYLTIADILPGDEDAWYQWFRPEIIGWIGCGLLGANATLTASISQTQLAAQPVGELSGPPVDVQAVVRNGYVPQGTVVPALPSLKLDQAAYLLDLDLFVEARQALDPDELTAQYRVLHSQVDRFFRWTLTDSGAARFGLQEVGG